jgi:hypothetical protein
VPGEPAGLIATRTAGAARFAATLSWRRPEEMPPQPTLLLPEWPGAGTARISVAETEDPGSAGRRIVGEIRALTQQELGLGLGAILRSVTTAATLTDAVLEVEAVRSVTPKAASPRALQELARDLWEAGFLVRFAASWTPDTRADVCVGVGANRDLGDFLSTHSSWRIV